ncbi:MAG TPA: inorganic phosphate transporter [Thermoanaerobaculia bacterium]|nr:inorganic phosphate transporter [Thermoanaerobaculia bacterium]
MTAATALVVFIIIVALTFDFLNGFHDAANSIATVVSTRVLSPNKAVAWAAFFNFVAAFVLGTHVAKTIGSGMIDLAAVTKDVAMAEKVAVAQEVILAGLIGAILWNLITWYYGLPVSSSHALIGGYAGAAIMKARSFGVIIPSGWTKTLLFIVLAPLIGLIAGFFLMVAVSWIVRRWRPSRVDRQFRKLQLLSAAAYSLGHGGNDAQKTMGIITGLLVASGFLTSSEVPLWVILLSQAAIALGTLFGGWRIVQTMGTKITKLQPVGGFCAETAGALTLVGATLAGIPVSTTHTITGAIIGVGSTRRLSAVKWGVAGRIVWAWVLTIPISAAIAAVAYLVVSRFI